MGARAKTQPAFAVVVDIAATWEDYRVISQAVGITLAGALLVHAAGPTEGGIRTIEIWDSEDAWRCHWGLVGHTFAGLSMPPVVRELQVAHLIYKEQTA